MQPNEIILRESYLNVVFKGLTHDAENPSRLTDDDLMRLYTEAREKAEQPMEKIISETTAEFGENVSSLLRHEGYYGVYTTVPVALLCFDDGHESYGLFHCVPIKRGERLVDFYRKNQDNPQIKSSVDFINSHKDFFNKQIPIIVRPFGDLFEVSEGNHRAFCAIMNQDASIPALIATKDLPKNPVSSLDFVSEKR